MTKGKGAREAIAASAASAANSARERYLAEFDAFASNGASGAPEWLRTLRKEAIDRFAEVGFPTTKDERWRFTSVDSIVKTEFARAGDDAVDAPDIEPYLIGDEASRIVAVTVNGRFVPPSRRSAVPPSALTVTGIPDAIANQPELLHAHLARHADPQANPFTALSTAFVADGVFVRVAADVDVETPVQVVHLTTGAGGPTVTHPRTLVVVERGARVSLVETYAGPADAVYWTNAATEVVVGENAVVDAYRIQREGDRAFHTAISHSRQDRNSVFSLNAFAFGSTLSRHDLTAVLDGEGAEATLNGLSVLAGAQHVDHHTTIDHAKPHCNSWELFNGILDDRARGVFTGRIVVRPGAQKTDSKQTNNNLLLTKTARADSQPQLEIYADDVRCTHGATLGPIDEKSMFYLRSRGLSAEGARNLLTYGFGAEILNAVADDGLRAMLESLVHGQLGR